ncbi:MAG: transaldolase [Methylococcales bacterium]|jgi:transaldolase|nr:transaldolase [Methylococcales bacterium]
MNLLEQLREMTVVVADTGDLKAIEECKPQDATTNPSLITAAAQMPEYQGIVDETLSGARETLGSTAAATEVVTLAFDRLAVSFGLKILDLIPGRVSTEVDARLSYDTEATITKGREIIAQYETAGVSRDRILIKIASTWEGIQAAAVLEDEGISCNLTLLFGLHQAIACADNNITLISPFVGRILDWYKKDSGRDSYPAAEDPGVISVTDVYNYYKRFGYTTEVMGASFRNLGEITELAGVDLLTISPGLINELATTEGELPQKLNAADALNANIERIAVNKDVFDVMHAENRMASDKLSEGIAGFTAALEKLETLLADRLSNLEKPVDSVEG